LVEIVKNNFINKLQKALTGETWTLAATARDKLALLTNRRMGKRKTTRLPEIPHRHQSVENIKRGGGWGKNAIQEGRKGIVNVVGKRVFDYTGLSCRRKMKAMFHSKKET